jgi:hypothetical protein
MSALPPKADIRQRDLDVRFVPKADIDCFIRCPQSQSVTVGLRSRQNIKQEQQHKRPEEYEASLC